MRTVKESPELRKTRRVVEARLRVGFFGHLLLESEIEDRARARVADAQRALRTIAIYPGVRESAEAKYAAAAPYREFLRELARQRRAERLAKEQAAMNK